MSNFIVKPYKASKRAAKRVKLRFKARKSTNTITAIIKKLDTLFSSIVRQRYADKEGIVACYTCGHKNHWKKMQCGHYLSRFYKAARWDFDNARPQCMMCNMWKRGDPVNFRRKLVEEIGLARVVQLEDKRYALFKEPLSWYEQKLLELTSV